MKKNVVFFAHPIFSPFSFILGDGSHPNQAGSYLTACTMLETIWGVSCEGNSYKPVGDSVALQTLAHNTVKARNWEWPSTEGPPCPQCLG